MDKVKSLAEYISNGYGLKEDLSCSETILSGANRVWNLGLDKNALIMAGGLSAGCYVESICGAISAGALVLARLYIKDKSHEENWTGDLVKELIEKCQEQMGSEICSYLREHKRTEEEKCRPVIIATALVLDNIVHREGLPEGDRSGSLS